MDLYQLSVVVSYCLLSEGLFKGKKVCVKLAITYIIHANNWFAVFSLYTNLFIKISPFIDIPVSLSEAFL